MSVSWCYRPGWWHVRVDGSQICLPLHVIDQVDDMWGWMAHKYVSLSMSLTRSMTCEGGWLTNMSPSACHWPGRWHVRVDGAQICLPLHVIDLVNDMCWGETSSHQRLITCVKGGGDSSQLGLLTNMSPSATRSMTCVRGETASSACHQPGQWHVWELVIGLLCVSAFFSLLYM